ncbi:MAG: phosphatidylglycerophosphatase A [Nitrospinota bacterium]
MPEKQIEPADWPLLAIATGFGSGYCPIASGTAGSVVGVAIFILIHDLSWPLYLVITVAVVAVGIPISTRAEKIYGEKDCGKIVIDEIAGQLVALFAVPLTVPAVAAGFLLFRLFDIVKPGFRRLEKIQGGAGIMIDDVLAGLMALIVLQAFLYHY